MSAPKSKAKLSVNEHVKARLNAVKDFLSGRSGEAKAANTADQESREAVAAELLAAMSSANHANAQVRSPDNQDTPDDPLTPASGEMQPLNAVPQPEQERARHLFLQHGYFDEAVENLGAAKTAPERAAAARALGLVGSQRATPHLIAALFDDDLEVRTAAEEALTQIGDKSVTQNETQRGSNSVLPSANLNAVNLSGLQGENVVTNNQPVTLDNVQPETKDLSTPTVTAPESSEVLQSPTEADDRKELEDLRQREQSVRQSAAEIDQRLLEIASALAESENQIRWRVEREVKLRSEAEAARLEEERLRAEAEASAEARRKEAREAVRAEQAAQLQSEADIQRHAENENSLRLKASELRASVFEIVRQRSVLDNERADAAEAAHRGKAEQARDEARMRHEAGLGRLRREEDTFAKATQDVVTQHANVVAAREKATNEIARLKEEQAAAEAAQREEVARLQREAEARNAQMQEQSRVELEKLREARDLITKRRAEVEAAREKADADAEILLQAQARMRTAEQARAQAELERSQLEAQINEQVETQRRLLNETRQRELDEKKRLQEDLRLHAEKEQQHLAEIESLKLQAEADSKQRLEREQQMRTQIDSLRIADAETRRRIADAEAKRRAADDAYRSIAEKVQRVEQEAHARAKEEEQILAKLEAERRTVAIEAQSRSEQEKRIRNEIEMFRRLEEEERPRVESATLQLAEAEARMEERKQQQRRESETIFPGSGVHTFAADLGHVPEADYSDAGTSSGNVATPAFEDNVRQFVASAKQEVQPVEPDVNKSSSVSTSSFEFSTLTPAIATYLNSVDPYKRAAAVAELARLGSPDAFNRISECFDDHSLHVRNAAARALRTLEPVRTVDLFNRALEEASAERRQNIGAAISASGLAEEAINNLGSDKREETYNALSILFVMAKTGEVSPLLRAREQHPNDDIGRAVSKLLTLSGYREGQGK